MPKHNDEKPEDEKRQREKELQDLWRRRDDLNEPEWNRLYHLIYLTLSNHRRTFWGILEQLPEDFKIYVWDFFTKIVVEKTISQGSRIRRDIHSGALCVFFLNFLKSELRAIKRQPRSFQLREPNPDDLQESILDRLKQSQIHSEWQPSPDQAFTLSKFGLDQRKVLASAKDFFNPLTPEERFLFKEHFAEGKKLTDLAKQMNKPVEEIRDVTWQLGTSINNHLFPYPETHIGQWLTDIGLFPDPNLDVDDPEEREVVFIVLQILRACALDGVDADRRSGSGPHDPPPAAGPSVSPR
ncbi:MAG: hypothetical protein P9F19_12305 [Candidatus Contendobacter sp.]|nr:hypothetical protein [Candidatus Contendobacter sp.]